eukprot:15476880-Heterocapsa_arctica.AAC.1
MASMFRCRAPPAMLAAIDIIPISPMVAFFSSLIEAMQAREVHRSSPLGKPMSKHLSKSFPMSMSSRKPLMSK